MNIARIAPPRLRTKEDEGKRAATWLELFYDLAFVVAVAFLSARLLGDITWPGMASYFAYFALLWWLWASHTFYADRYDTDDLVYRLLASGQMVAVVVIAASLQGDSQSTMVFAIGYALARTLLVAMYWRAYRHVPETRELVRGYVFGFGLASVVWIAAIFTPENARFILWAVALAVDLATPWVMRREQAKVPLDVSHVPERFGLFTILVLGESIAAISKGLTHVACAPKTTVAAAVSIGIAVVFWWLYFDNARGKVVRRVATVRRTWRPTGWIYTHLPLAAGLAALAVAMERAIEEAGHGSMPGADRWLLIGSACVVLGALALIQHTSTNDPEDFVSRGITLNRLLGIPVLLVLGLLSTPESQFLLIGLLGVGLAELVGDLTLNAKHSMSEEDGK